MPDCQPPITWIKKQDGRLVPFDPDEISRGLFAASQRLGSPDAFLARELTDGVLHFLASELDNGTATTGQVVETVVKVVRELGHPGLSQAFHLSQTELGAREAADISEDKVLAWDDLKRLVTATPSEPDLARQLGWACLRAYSLREVFGPELVAAHDQGLITLSNLETPQELAGLVLAAGEPHQAVAEAREVAGQFVAVDGPEHVLTGDPRSTARQLQSALRTAGLWAVVNLNAATPPNWAGNLADGPLFADRSALLAGTPIGEVADHLLEQLLESHTGSKMTSGAVRVDWHLAAADFESSRAGWLLHLARRALDGSRLAFVMDRSNRPVSLAEGIDRRHPVLLMTVALNLPNLADQAGVRRNPAIFLQKLGSLARIAVSAGVQKREFLRNQATRHPAITRGFLLDRARLMVEPVGLELAVRSMLGVGLCASQEALDLARHTVEQIGVALENDGRSRHLEVCLDGPASFSCEGPASSDSVSGLTRCDMNISPLEQVRVAESLHAQSVVVLLPAERLPAAESLADLLRHVWRKTGIARVRFKRLEDLQRQLTVNWGELSGEQTGSSTNEKPVCS
jgi:hypothetical protein